MNLKEETLKKIDEVISRYPEKLQCRSYGYSFGSRRTGCS